jgi:predicted transcriptional regulator
VTPAFKQTWNRIASRLKELGLSPSGRANVPKWLLGEVLRGRDPELTELVSKLMSQGLDELEQDEKEALLGAIIGDKPKE